VQHVAVRVDDLGARVAQLRVLQRQTIWPGVDLLEVFEVAQDLVPLEPAATGQRLLGRLHQDAHRGHLAPGLPCYVSRWSCIVSGERAQSAADESTQDNLILALEVQQTPLAPGQPSIFIHVCWSVGLSVCLPAADSHSRHSPASCSGPRSSAGSAADSRVRPPVARTARSTLVRLVACILARSHGIQTLSDLPSLFPHALHPLRATIRLSCLLFGPAIFLPCFAPPDRRLSGLASVPLHRTHGSTGRLGASVTEAR
jgi:hypothetical protein